MSKDTKIISDLRSFFAKNEDNRVFEKCIARLYDSPIAIVFHISNSENNINVMIESDAKIKDTIEFQKQLQKQFPNSLLKTSDDVTYYTLIIPCGGNL